MASPSALAQGLQGYNFMLTPQANAQLRTLSQQQLLGQTLQGEGLEGLDTKGRQIGGIGYNISPWEGASKIAQALVGSYEQKSANNKFNDMMNPQPAAAPAPPPPPTPKPYDENPQATPILGGVSSQQAAPGYAADAPQAPPPQQDAQGPFSPQFTAALQGIMQKYNVSMPEAMTIMQDPSALSRVIAANAPTGEMKNAVMAYGPTGAPNAVRNIMNNQQFPGAKTMQEGLGSAAAAQQPAGTLPAGAPGQMPGMPTAPQGGITPPMSGYQIGDDGIHLPVPPPGATSGVQGLPPAAAATIQNAATPLPGSQIGAGPGQQPINPAGMTNAQMEAAVKTQGAGASANASKLGENLAEAQKNYNVMASNVPLVMQRLDQMLQASRNASYGTLANDQNTGLVQEFHNNRNDPTAVANGRLQQLTAQGVLPEIGPMLATGALRGNKFLEQMSANASGISLHDSPAVREQKIEGLRQNFLNMLQSGAQQIGGYGGQAPQLPYQEKLYNGNTYRKVGNNWYAMPGAQ